MPSVLARSGGYSMQAIATITVPFFAIIFFGYLAARLRWVPHEAVHHIKKEAIEQSHLCDDEPTGERQDACRERNFGKAVVWAEPELAGQCRASAPGYSEDAVAECAKKRFLDAWANGEGMISVRASSNASASPECAPAASLAERKLGLRELLRKRLAERDSLGNDSRYRVVDASSAAKAEPTKPPSPPLQDDDEAYCNYMAREVVRGELVPSLETAIPSGCHATIAAALELKAQHGTEPFTMSADETDRVIAKLMALGPVTGGQFGATLGGRIKP